MIETSDWQFCKRVLSGDMKKTQMRIRDGAASGLAAFLCLVCVVWLSTSAEEAVAQQGNASKSTDTSSISDKDIAAAKLFGEKCSGCHTVGKGNLVGPDLQGATGRTTDELIASVTLMQKMAGPLTDAEIKSLVAFVKSSHAADAIKKSEEHALAESTTAAPASAKVGRGLFFGSQKFTNGGLSCITCHKSEGTGGTLGPDLNGVFEKFGENSLISACEQTNFKVMKAAYHDHPITRQEALHLTKYFGSLKKQQAGIIDPPIEAIGFGEAVIFLIGLSYFYRKRKKNVRDQLNRR